MRRVSPVELATTRRNWGHPSAHSALPQTTPKRVLTARPASSFRWWAPRQCPSAAIARLALPPLRQPRVSSVPGAPSRPQDHRRALPAPLTWIPTRAAVRVRATRASPCREAHAPVPRAASSQSLVTLLASCVTKTRIHLRLDRQCASSAALTKSHRRGAALRQRVNCRHHRPMVRASSSR